MKSSAMFVSLLFPGESLTCAGSDDLPTSVPLYYRDSDSGETVDVIIDNFAVGVCGILLLGLRLGRNGLSRNWTASW